MSLPLYRNVRFTVDGGGTHEVAEGFSYARKPEEGTKLLVPSPTLEVSASTVVPAADFDLSALEKFLVRDPVGASAATLARRVSYGGRKARSALRRLRARATPMEIRTGDFVLRGRAVILDASDPLEAQFWFEAAPSF